MCSSIGTVSVMHVFGGLSVLISHHMWDSGTTIQIGNAIWHSEIQANLFLDVYPCTKVLCCYGNQT